MIIYIIIFLNIKNDYIKDVAKYTLDLTCVKASLTQNRFESLTIDTPLKYYYHYNIQDKKLLKRS